MLLNDCDCENCEEISESCDRKPTTVPKKEKCSCGKKICKDTCSNKPCYKEPSLEEVLAKQMLELMSCGCGQLVCVDTCKRKPCAAKIQIKGEECLGKVAKEIVKPGCGKSGKEDSFEIVPTPTRNLSKDGKDQSCTLNLGGSYVVVSKPASEEENKGTLNVSESYQDVTKPTDTENENNENQIEDIPIDAIKDSRQEITSLNLSEDIPKSNEAQNSEDDPDCGCLSERKPRRSSKIPRRIISNQNALKQIEGIGVETDSTKLFSVLKILETDDDCKCVEDEDKRLNISKDEPKQEEKIRKTDDDCICVEDEDKRLNVEPIGDKNIDVEKKKTKSKKKSCGCNRTECKDTCKYKPCKSGTCGCNNKVCKDSCKRKPCYKNDEELMEDDSNGTVTSPQNTPRDSSISPAKTPRDSSISPPKTPRNSSMTPVINENEPIEQQSSEQEVTEEVSTEERKSVRVSQETTNISLGEREKPTSENIKTIEEPSNPLNNCLCNTSKENDCGCRLEECKDSCKQKPCKTDAPILSVLPAYVKNLIGEISCLCNKPQGQKLTKNESQYRPTISTLKIGLEALRDKCKNKDMIIDCLRREIQNHGGSNVFSDMLARAAQQGGNSKDFDRLMVARDLPVPDCYKSDGICGCTQGFDGCCKVDPSPLEIVDVMRIGGRCILVRWLGAESKDVVGYEVCIKGMVMTRVLDRERTSAILAWDNSANGEGVEISVYGCSEVGRCFPPAIAEYRTVIES